MTKKLTTITLAITLSLLCAACGARTVGGGPIGSNNNSNDNQNNNLNNNTNGEVEYLTRKPLFIQTANVLMGFMPDLGTGCESQYEDVDGTIPGPNGEYLCWSLEILEDLDVDTSSDEPGLFLPDQMVERHEMWRVVTDSVHFFPYRAECSRIIAEGEHQPYLGALCDKGMLSEYESFEKVSLHEWYDFAHIFGMFLDLPATRVYILEVMLRSFMEVPNILEPECTPRFPDVEANSLRCIVVNLAVDADLAHGYPNGTFGPDNEINWAEFFKTLTSAAGIPAQVATGCFGCDERDWYCPSIDALCELGLLPEDFENPADTPTLGEALHVIYETDLLL